MSAWNDYDKAEKRLDRATYALAVVSTILGIVTALGLLRFLRG